MRISDWSSDVCSSDLAYVNFLASLSGKPFVPIGSSGPLNQRCASLNAAGLPSVLPTLRTLSEDNVSWRAGLDFRLAPETLLYANISKGYKGGTFPVQGAVIEQQYRPVTQESVLADRKRVVSGKSVSGRVDLGGRRIIKKKKKKKKK